MLKKNLSLAILSVCAITALAGCSKKDNSIKLKVWVPTEETEVMNELIAGFKAANADKKYDITVVNLAEGDTRSELEKDPDAAADIFATTDESCQQLASKGQIYQIPEASQYYTNVTTLNGAGSVAGVTFNGNVYGFPETADNGWYLNYNSTYVTAEEAKSLEALVAKAEALNKKVYFPYTNGWYAIGYLNANGGTLSHNEQGPVCNWKETAVATTKAMYNLAKSAAFVDNGDNDQIIAGMKSGDVIAAFTGTWNYTALSEIDGFACAENPTITIAADKKVHMSSFSGGKVVCVNKVSKNPTEAMKLADYMTNEAAQTKRFNKRALGPSNINAANSDAVKANPAIQALAKQSAYSVSQSASLSSAMSSVYWDAAGGLGTHFKEQDWENDEQMVASLNVVVDTILNAK